MGFQCFFLGLLKEFLFLQNFIHTFFLQQCLFNKNKNKGTLIILARYQIKNKQYE